jgi:hypothetical protein
MREAPPDLFALLLIGIASGGILTSVLAAIRISVRASGSRHATPWAAAAL